MQFLIQEDGLQTSSIYSSFNERYLDRFQIFFLLLLYTKTLSEHLHSIRGDFCCYNFVLSKCFYRKINHRDKLNWYFLYLDEHRLFVVKYFIKNFFHLMVLKFKYLIIHNKVIQYPIKMDCKSKIIF
jgi:hypothetical protein